MPLPHLVARLNKRFTNRFIEPIVRRTDGFAVVHHHGRRSGKPYITPVKLFYLNRNGNSDLNRNGDAVVSLTYGPTADWAQNVLARGGKIEDLGGLRTITSAKVVDRSVAWPALSPLVRGWLRLLRVHQFMELSFTPHEPEASPLD